MKNELVPIPGLELCREDYKTNLQYYRNEKRLTQAELARRANVNLRTLQDYEQGQKNINNARTATVSRLAEVLGVTITDLLEYEHKE